MRPKLVIASNNPGKLREFRELLGEFLIDLSRPTDLGLVLDVAETGTSYGENARLKALAFSAASGLPALADDTGLEIAAFSGWPGIHSVRFAGPDADDASRRAAVLARLAGPPSSPRQATFVCAIAIAIGDTIVAQGEGRLEGDLAAAPSGSGGFGYDPIFVPRGLSRTVAELSADEKNRISHRARAVDTIGPWLVDYSRRRAESWRGV